MLEDNFDRHDLDKKHRMKSLYLLFEVFNHPDTLTISELDSQLVEILGILLRKGPIAVQIVTPGICLLCVHPDSLARQWAQSSLLKLKQKIDDHALDGYIGILKAMFMTLRSIEMPESSGNSAASSFNISHDPNQLWAGISTVLRVVSDGAANVLFNTHISNADEIVSTHFSSFPIECYWESLSVYRVVLKSGQCYWTRSVCAAETRIAVFHNVIHGFLSLVDNLIENDNLEFRTSTILTWIGLFIQFVPPDGLRRGAYIEAIGHLARAASSWPTPIKRKVIDTIKSVFKPDASSDELNAIMSSLSIIIPESMAQTIETDINMIVDSELSKQKLQESDRFHVDIWTRAETFKFDSACLSRMLQAFAKLAFSSLFHNSTALSPSQNKMSHIIMTARNVFKLAEYDKDVVIPMQSQLFLICFNDRQLHKCAKDMFVIKSSVSDLGSTIETAINKHVVDNTNLFCDALYQQSYFFRKALRAKEHCMASTEGFLSFIEKVAKIIFDSSTDNCIKAVPKFRDHYFDAVYQTCFIILDSAKLWSEVNEYSEARLVAIKRGTIKMMKVFADFHLKLDKNTDISGCLKTAITKTAGLVETNDKDLIRDALEFVVNLIMIVNTIRNCAHIQKDLFSVVVGLKPLFRTLTTVQCRAITGWLAEYDRQHNGNTLTVSNNQGKESDPPLFPVSNHSLSKRKTDSTLEKLFEQSDSGSGESTCYPKVQSKLEQFLPSRTPVNVVKPIPTFVSSPVQVFQPQRSMFTAFNKPAAPVTKLGAIREQMRLEQHRNVVRAPRMQAPKIPQTTRTASGSSRSTGIAKASAKLTGLTEEIRPRTPSPDRKHEPRSIMTIELPHVKQSSKLSRLNGTGKRSGVSEKKKVATIKDLFRTILEWEMDMNADTYPPNIDAQSFKKVPDVFQDAIEYLEVFQPLLFMECWGQFNSARDENNFDDKEELKFTALNIVDNSREMSFQGSADSVRSLKWSENTILCLTPPRNVKPVLSRIMSISVKANMASIVCETFLEKRTDVMQNLQVGTTWEAFQVFSLTTSLREYNSILLLSSISLKEDILKPMAPQKSIVDESKINECQTAIGVNFPQARAITAAIAQRSGFVLIQGPPGTGKTKTILGLIGALQTTATTVAQPNAGASNYPYISNHSGEKNKLLCCAPSNAAIDEITRRLMEGVMNSKGKKIKLKIVRVGTVSVHPDCEAVTLENLLEQSLKQNQDYREGEAKISGYASRVHTLRRELDELKAARNLLGTVDKETVGDGVSNGDKYTQITNQMSEIARKLDSDREARKEGQSVTERLRRELRQRILKESDVVLTTLSGAGLEIFSEDGMRFNTVIIDEACQAVELSCLIPLRYGAKKCIMVGDPNQLPPTVLSLVGQDYSYEQSLFQRLMKKHADSIHLLSIQYRMHPEISKFPSKYFYQSRLTDADNLDKQCEAPWHHLRYFPPYLMLDAHAGSEVQRANGKSLFNQEEINMCVELVKYISSHCGETKLASRIGIISFYKLQIHRLREAFKNAFGNKILDTIDINTVDGFQGQEKDIIILSCVRANNRRGVGFISDVRRMNVGLTRARQSLVILGNAAALKGSEVWNELVRDADDRKLLVDVTARQIRSESKKSDYSNLYGDTGSKGSKENEGKKRSGGRNAESANESKRLKTAKPKNGKK